MMVTVRCPSASAGGAALAALSLLAGLSLASAGAAALSPSCSGLIATRAIGSPPIGFSRNIA